MSARQVVLSRAKEWVSRVNTAADQLYGDELDALAERHPNLRVLRGYASSLDWALASRWFVQHLPRLRLA